MGNGHFGVISHPLAGEHPMLTPLYGSLGPLTLRRAAAAGASLGPELVSNGTFTGGSLAGWTKVTSVGILVGNAPGGHANLINGDPETAIARTPVSTLVGKTYRASCKCLLATYSISAAISKSNAPDGSLSSSVIGEFSSTGSGTANLEFVATATTSYIVVMNYPTDDGEGGVNTSEFLFDNISVKEVL